MGRGRGGGTLKVNRDKGRHRPAHFADHTHGVPHKPTTGTVVITPLSPSTCRLFCLKLGHWYFAGAAATRSRATSRSTGSENCLLASKAEKARHEGGSKEVRGEREGRGGNGSPHIMRDLSIGMTKCSVPTQKLLAHGSNMAKAMI